MITWPDRRLLPALVLWFFFLPAWGAVQSDELVLIVNPHSGVDAIDREDVVNIFMGRFHRLPSGVSAIPVDFVPAKADFYELLVQKKLSEINGYWARLVFSGRASPPLQLRTPEELLRFVTSNRGAIGYLPRRHVSDDVKVLTDMSAWK